MRGGKEMEVSLGKCKYSTGNMTKQTALMISKRIPLQEEKGGGNMRVQNSCTQMQHIPEK